METAVVGRSAELDALERLRAGAGTGAPAVVVLDGEAGSGKTALLRAAALAARGEGWDVLAAGGIDADAHLAHAGLAGLVTGIRDHLPAVPAVRRDALEAALGGRPGGASGDRFLIGAAVLSLLAEAAAATPRLVLVDDAQWLDRGSLDALLFAARRLTHDRVAFVIARRRGAGVPARLDDLPVIAVDGLDPNAATRLLAGRVLPAVVDRLHAGTGGNPLALLECARRLSPAQRSGAAPLPTVLPVGSRLVTAFVDRIDALDDGARRALLLMAARDGDAAAPVLAALAAEGIDADACLTAARDLVDDDGARLAFAHPLVRSAVWEGSTPAERRSAHRALARVLPPGPARTWASAAAVDGYDDGVAADLAALADSERARRGYAAAGEAAARAARLTTDPDRAAVLLAFAAEDAFLAGDGARALEVAGEVLAASPTAEPRARALATLAAVEQYTGRADRARDLFTEAATTATGRLLTRTLVDLAHISYVIGDFASIEAAAARADRDAEREDPEQAMHRDYLVGMAAVLAGEPEKGAEPLGRALTALETEPTLRGDPRHLLVALLVSRWQLDPGVAAPFAARRIAEARALGALGVLAPALSLMSGGMAMLGDHRSAYAFAGEAATLLDALGYATEPGIAHEMLAVESAARGRHEEAERSLARARGSVITAGFPPDVPHLARAVAFCALCAGRWDDVVAVLEDQIARNGGVGDYLEPLGVAPDLIEAYLALNRAADARALARDYAAANPTPPRLLAGVIHRCLAQTASRREEARAEFERAVVVDADSGTFEAARTRLAFGRFLRKSGERIEARAHLTAAAQAFDRMDLSLWVERAEVELAATGSRRTPRRALDVALTAQETNVALLVARGMTNAEVAAALFLSPRTVEHHLGAVLRKKGLRSRTELAAALAGA